MEVKAISKALPVSPKRARLILDEIRGKRVDEAISALRFMSTPHARRIAKIVRSAAANAENNYNLGPHTLQITTAYASDSVRLKRMIPRARGRADVMRRRRSNVTIIVDDRSES